MSAADGQSAFEPNGDIYGSRNLDIAGAATVAGNLTVSGEISGDIHAAAGSIGTTELADEAVTNAKIGALAVDTTELADDAVTAAKIDPTAEIVVADVDTSSCTGGLNTLYTQAKALANEIKADIAGPLSALTWTVTDDDSAASKGAALYVDASGPASLGALSANTGTGGITPELDSGSADPIFVVDSGGSVDGSQVYYDEAGGVLTTNSGTSGDLHVAANSGRMIKITHNADPSGAGHLPVYFYASGTLTERLLFVSGSDQDGSVSAETSIQLFYSPPTISADDIA